MEEITNGFVCQMEEFYSILKVVGNDAGCQVVNGVQRGRQELGRQLGSGSGLDNF